MLLLTFLVIIVCVFLFLTLIFTIIHERGHKFALRRTAKRLDLPTPEVKWQITSFLVARTESELYTYLAENRENPVIQKEIRSNARSGQNAVRLLSIFSLIVCFLCFAFYWKINGFPVTYIDCIPIFCVVVIILVAYGVHEFSYLFSHEIDCIFKCNHKDHYSTDYDYVKNPSSFQYTKTFK